MKPGAMKRQARLTARDVAMWPAWMRRAGGNLEIDAGVQDELTGELAKELQQTHGVFARLNEEDSTKLARTAFEKICGWQKKRQER